MCPEDERQSQPPGCSSSARFGVTLTCGDLESSHEAPKTIWTSTSGNRTPQVEIHCPRNTGDNDKGFGSFVKRLMDAEAAIISAAMQIASFKDILKDSQPSAVNKQRMVKQRGLLLQKMEDFRQINQVVRKRLNQLLDEEADRIDASTKIDALLTKILQIERENQLLKGDLGVTEKRAEELMFLQQKEQENIKSALNIANNAEGTRARIQGQLRNKEAENNRLTVQVRTLERSLTQHKAEIDDLKASLTALTEQTSQEKEALKKASRVHKQKAERFEATLDKCLSQLQKKDAQLSTLQEKSETWKLEKEQLTEDKHKLTAHVELLQKQVIAIPIRVQKDMQKQTAMVKEWEREFKERMKERKEQEDKEEDWGKAKVEKERREFEDREKERGEWETREKEGVRERAEREKERWEWEDQEKEWVKERAKGEKKRREWEKDCEERQEKTRKQEKRAMEKARGCSSEREEPQGERVEETVDIPARHDGVAQQFQSCEVEKENDTGSYATLKLEEQLAECEAALVQEKSMSGEKDRIVEQFQSQVAALEAELNNARLQNISQDCQRMEDIEYSKADEVRQQLQVRVEELQHLPKMLKETEMKLLACQEKLQTSERKCSEQAEDIKNLQNELQTQVNLVKSTTELRESSSKLQEQVDTLQKTLEELRQEKLKLEQKLETQEQALCHSNQLLEQSSTRCTDLKRQLEQRMSECQAINQQLAQCSGDLLNFKEQVKNFKEQVLSKDEALQITVNELRLLRQNKLTAEKKFEARVKELQFSLDKCESHKKNMQNYVDFLKNSYLMIFEDQISTFWSSTFMK
ncbi:outer dense fiber protein 2-like isoform X1 [Syngnathus typhle]|uniref:outer dense fiber protein 2-like isoform X1 n=1 Tax=Syngnathus typhle TaxID=161592 RepID=UPI002A69D602|nr:outer dense fiber protein 2-like isoform X1 [Syngnathus typhle]XP_061151569.1 outer dense fiber protein 2-like isoform X1 [Syngnathus typhle]